jgi:hypothetical protein
MTKIRNFESYDDACRAAHEAGFRFITDSNEGQTAGRSFAPTVTYRHPETDEEIKVAWNSGRGSIWRTAA